MSDYITSAALKSTLNITSTDFDNDIAAAITAASRAIDDICERRFYPDADANQVRYYSPDNDTVLEINDLITLTSLASDDDGTFAFANAWTQNTDFVLEPLNASADSEPWTQIRALPQGSFTFNTFFPRSVKLTGKFGWAAVPQEVVQAATILAARLFKISREAPLGVIEIAGAATYVGRSDSGVMGLVSPLMRHRIAVG